MNAKNYLRKIKQLDVRIDIRQKELEQLKASADGLHSPQYGDKVQTSHDNTSMDTVVKYVDLANDINRMIDYFVDYKHKVIGEIESLEDERYAAILFKRYVEYKTLEQISCEMNYAYQYTRSMHGYALQAFAKLHTQ